MKTKRRVRKSNIKSTPSRRKPANKANKRVRLTNRISKRSPTKSRKKFNSTGKTKMNKQNPISNVATFKDDVVKHVKKLLGDETIDAIPAAEDEGNLLQDLDLLVLGSPPAEYKRYRELLRQEYSHLDDSSYKQMRLKLSDAQPSTSQQAIASQRDVEQSSTKPSVNRSPRQKKPFVKFKDNQYRKARIEKRKSILSKTTFPDSLRATPSTSQIASRKILRRSIKKQLSSLGNESTSQSQTKHLNKNNKENTINVSSIPTKNDQLKTLQIQADIEDDCVCIDPQPEVILIDDESIVSPSVESESPQSGQQIVTYDPIGSMRMNQLMNTSQNLFTSTSQLLGNSYVSSLEVPLYGYTNMDADVVVIEDTIASSSNTVKRRKRKRAKPDDSVIFVSEQVNGANHSSTAPAYISLYTPVEESHFKIAQSRTSTPKPKRFRNELFNSQEQKQLQQYNENAYNPNKGAETTKKRMVIVDGSNVAFHHALNKEFSVKGLKICLDYFEKMGHEVKAVVPQFRLQRLKSTDPSELEKLHQNGKIVFTPCKNLPGKSSTSYDDRFVLQLAAELDAAVVSNDNYRDLIHESPALKKIIENRVIGYTWCNDLFILPKDPYGKWGPTLSTILNRS